MMRCAFGICIMTLLTLAYFYFATTRADKSEILVACSVQGFFMLPILMVAYELAVAQTSAQGVGESMSCGLINVYANTFGFLLAISLTPALAKKTEGST